MPQFVDIADLKEDDRIDLIGHRVMDHRDVVSFIVEDDAKADRYIEKLQKKFPCIIVAWRGLGPVPGTIAIKVKENPS